MEVQLLARFLHHFVTSLIIHIAKKLTYYIDDMFTDAFDEKGGTIVCESCGSKLRAATLIKINEDVCPNCNNKIIIPGEVISGRYKRKYR